MWFRRRRKQQPPVLLPPVDRLAELVDRVVTLLDEVPAPPPPEPAAAKTPDETVAHEHVAFAPGSAGYRLLVREGPVPAVGERLESDEVRYRVLRLGPSPLPGDRRRCAFLEQEQHHENRSPTGAGGEPDRGHESGLPG